MTYVWGKKEGSARNWRKFNLVTLNGFCLDMRNRRNQKMPFAHIVFGQCTRTCDCKNCLFFLRKKRNATFSNRYCFGRCQQKVKMFFKPRVNHSKCAFVFKTTPSPRKLENFSYWLMKNDLFLGFFSFRGRWNCRTRSYRFLSNFDEEP